jgi:SAM-dependent methyltransferase
MDYDKIEIPTRYDKARVLAPETRRLWHDLLSVHIGRAAVSLIIDLGCGTGRFSELLAGHFSAQVIGIDPSLKMLDQAHRKPAIGNVVYCQGLAEVWACLSWSSASSGLSVASAGGSCGKTRTRRTLVRWASDPQLAQHGFMLNGGVPVTTDFPNRRAGVETMWR